MLVPISMHSVPGTAQSLHYLTEPPQQIHKEHGHCHFPGEETEATQRLSGRDLNTHATSLK